MPQRRKSLSADIPASAKDLSTWKTVNEQAILKTDAEKAKEIAEKEKKRLERYQQRCAVVRAYFDGEPLKDICRTYNVSRNEIKRLRTRALLVHDDGENWGFRALLPYAHIEVYERQESSQCSGSRTHGGLSGAFSQLLDTYPDLASWIERQYLKKDRETDPSLALDQRISFEDLHDNFLVECKKQGIAENEYPFNTERQARESLRRFCKAIASVNFAEAAKARGGETAGRLARQNSSEGQYTPGSPYRRLVLDGHRLDALMTVTYRLPDGGETTTKCRRSWILILIDEDTRVVLNAVQTYGRNYDATDVRRLIVGAIGPKVRPTLTIPGLRYDDDAGWPQDIESLVWAIWEEVAFDNHWGHFARYAIRLLRDTLRCRVNPGPAAAPEARGICERFMRRLEQSFGHRLPSTVGSGPQDPRRQDPEKEAERFRIASTELDEVLDVVVADYNGTIQPGAPLYKRSPLEVIRQRLNQGFYPRVLEENKRDEVTSNKLWDKVKVCGSLERGKRPYVNFFNVVYRSAILSDSPALIGLTLDVQFIDDDMRTVRAYLPSGAELGELRASGEWGEWKHTLSIRRAIFKLARKKIIKIEANPIRAYHDYLRARAGTDANAAGDLNRLQISLNSDGASRATSPAVPIAATAPVTTPDEANALPVVSFQREPRRLKGAIIR